MNAMRTASVLRRAGPIVAAALLALAALAQQGSLKRPLTHGDYDSWRSIQSQTLSRDGRFLAYALFPQEGDGELVLRDLGNGQERRESLGALPPAPDIDPSSLEPGEDPPRRGVTIRFTSDGRYLISTANPSREETEKARRERKRPDEMPKDGLVLMDTASGAVTRIAEVKNMQVPEKGGSWLAYLKEEKPASRPPEERKSAPPAPGARGRGRPTFGTDLILRDLAGGGERVFADSAEYSFAKDGKTLVFATSSRKQDDNGVWAVTPGSDAAPAVLLGGKGKYTRLTWDREQKRLAFLSDRDDQSSRPAKHKLYLWARGPAAASEMVSTQTPGFKDGWVISERGTINFSRDGSRMFFGCGPPSPPEPEGEAPLSDAKVVADLWHYRDDNIQPMQKVRANQERSRSYRAVFHLADKRFLQLSDPSLAGLSPSDDGRWGFGSDDRQWRRQVDYDGSYSDVYLVDTANGTRKLVVERLAGGGGGGGGFRGSGGGVTWSPDGKHGLFFRNRHWHSVTVPGGVITNLTGSLGVGFHNEEHDSPSEPGSYGAAGWTKDGNWVLLYDRHDPWQVSADGAKARNVTEGAGRKNNLRFRYLRLETEEDNDDEPRGVDSAKPITLTAENLQTRETGFWRDRLDANAPPERLRMAASSHRVLGKARDADVVLLVSSTFADPPDLHVTDSSFGSPRRVSDANPRKAQLAWGSGELIRYRSADGIPLQGALYKPENFDGSKKYPLLVYIYERLSQGVHNFVEPRPGTSINAAYYVSNGYVVLMPDIAYRVGSPGQSALKCVLPAIQAVVDKGYVNENAIGIQGHSWGGYQIAYMVTQTNRFRAAIAGAPVANMTSAYNGIRWGSGLPRQFQYEKTQSRIGGPLWQYPMRFLENSPVFMADRVQTPLLILHNDQDDAVPWYQGIELFLSLRRQGKETYLFNYNGERHGLRQRHNQKDWTVRMQQFLDHYLKEGPKPAWMERGIPYIEREKEKEKAKASDQAPREK